MELKQYLDISKEKSSIRAEHLIDTMSIACIVIGGYVNGYAIIQELCEYNVPNLILVDYHKDPAYYSNKLKGRYVIAQSEDALLKILQFIHTTYDTLFLFPTQDVHLSHLAHLYNKIKAYCKVAFNVENVVKYQDKAIQYRFCEELGIPYPATCILKSIDDLDAIKALQFPIIVKATSRHSDVHTFRNAYCASHGDWLKKSNRLGKLLENGVELMVSEVIPGDGSNIFAYVGYRKSDGHILGEWTGRKLAQFPNDFGVFSSAKAEQNATVLQQGRTLLEAMNLWGIAEPEFKYDFRDGQYKLMEINLRPMMWHRVGALNKMPLNYIQYLDLKGEVRNRFECEYNAGIYANLWYEVLNLLKYRRYYKIFKQNVLSTHTTIALYDSQDIRPFFMALKTILRKVIGI